MVQIQGYVVMVQIKFDRNWLTANNYVPQK